MLFATKVLSALQSKLCVLALSGLLLLPMASTQAESRPYSNYLIRDMAFVDQAREAEFGTILSHVDNQAYEEANTTLQRFLSLHGDPIKSEYPLLYAQILTNQGIIKALLNDIEGAHTTLDKSIEVLESLQGQFDQSLVDPLMAKSLIHVSLEEHAAAEDLLRRVQHIIHRNDGVYSPRQLPVVNRLTEIKLQEGEMTDADQQQKFKLKIHRRSHGDDSEKMISVLQQIGAYFARRGDTIPLQAQQRRGQYRKELFREAISLYEQAISIIEDLYGPNDIRSIQPLRGLAQARTLEVTGRRYAEDVLERVVDIVEQSPETDLTDRVRALVDLADTYIITSDRRAEETYMKAWNLLADRPDLRDLLNQLFGTPERLYPAFPGVIVLDRWPYQADENEYLYVDAEYTVTANGRVSDVNIIDGNVPNAEKRSVRQFLSQTRFRPRIVDGEFKETTGLMLHLPFIVEEKEDEKNVSANMQTSG